ncbi:telomere-protecting terminal protein Tpg, partial [Streptomyces sp. NPDC056488]|uniref:telomere-protecting terminal protein Tpg n=1 Tax=Streptomyces sp. NPDC056488 TaxID=3345836 RepID=UPI0036764914
DVRHLEPLPEGLACYPWTAVTRSVTTLKILTDEERALQEARTRSKLLESLAGAERKLFTRNAPKLSKVCMKFLRTREKGSIRRLAERLGVSRSMVERHLSGASTRPNKRLDEVLERETVSEWKRQVRARARERAASSSGLVISFDATLGFTANGSSDNERVRTLQIAVSPAHAARILVVRDGGTADKELHDAVVEAIVDTYFRQADGGRAGLEVKFTDVEWLNIAL